VRRISRALDHSSDSDLACYNRGTMRKVLFVAGMFVLLMAFAFWCLGQPDIPRATLEAKYAHPPSQFMVLRDGARAHFRDRGPRDGEALILIHGSNDSLFTWEPWAMRLSDTLRIVTVDLPGHGLTGAVPSRDYSEEGMVQFVREVANALRLRPFTIGGNSMGGRIAARFTEEYPERVTHLILVDSGGLSAKRSPVFRFAFALASVGVVARPLLHIAPRWLVIEGINQAVARKEIMTEERIEGIWDLNHIEGARDATIIRFGDERSGVRNHLREINVPTLVLWGQDDNAMSVSAAHQFHTAIRNSKLIIYPHTGHLPQEEDAEESAADVRSFVLGLGK
jgi:pimeloyl-ACP methyl ester carboxylesterase